MDEPLANGALPSSDPPLEHESKGSASEPPVLFVMGKHKPKPISNKLSSTGRQITHQATKPKLSKPQRNVTDKRKSGVPVARSVPLAFPAASSFTFSTIKPAANISFTSKGKAPVRAIQVLPTDVLVMVIQAIELKHHRHLLQSLSLVNRALNAAIAPILYRNFRLPSLPDVYEFSISPRYPGCITSLEIFLAPDPLRREWSPPDPNWADSLISTLRKLERLMSLSINRWGNDAVLQSLAKLAKDPSFLPLLQKLSFGPWHQLSSLSSGRPVTSYGITFTLQGVESYERLEQLLFSLKHSKETARELKIIFDVPSHGETSPMDYKRNALDLIGKHMPGLHVLNVRFQRRNGQLDASINLSEVVNLIPPTLSQLVSLEFFDSRFPQFPSDQVMKAAAALSGQDGSCPNLQFINFDGLLWKHTTNDSSSPSDPSSLTLSLALASLSLESGQIDQTRSQFSAPILPWSPSPSNKRGRRWWERRVPKLNASSQAEAVSLLWQWMAEHWGKEYMVNVASLERTVTRW
ncbi:hypothetical protein FRC08_012583 [Ceratobasidium sp. 394]|nr:hypothetical protein FRC08_012583 [Ceratobasidium sp. 394]KAG9075034.1 hypothetical protein FS749_013336 [Ceratobasidium sp. UAMH 11750]